MKKTIILVLFTILFGFSCLASEMRVSNFTSQIELYNSYFDEEQGMIYRVKLGTLDYLVGLDKSIRFSERYDSINESGFINVLDNSKFTVLYNGKDGTCEVKDEETRNTIFNWLKPVLLSSVYYDISGRLIIDRDFLEQELRLQRDTEIRQERLEEMKTMVLNASSQLYILDIVQDATGMLFNAMLSGGLSLIGDTLTLGSFYLHNEKYQYLKEAVDRADETIDLLVESGEFSAIKEGYPFDDVIEMLDETATVYCNYGRAKEVVSFMTNYYVIRELNANFGTNWLNDAAKYIGNDGFLTSTAKKAIKDAKTSLWSLAASFVGTNTRKAQITGLKIAENLTMMLEINGQIRDLVKEQSTIEEWTMPYADSISFLLTVYKILDNNTLDLIKEYNQSGGAVYWLANFLVGLFTNEADLQSLIDLNKKEINLYLGNSFDVEETKYRVIGSTDLNDFYDPKFYDVSDSVANDTEFVKLRIQFEDNDGKTITERFKEFPIMNLDGKKIIMLYFPSHFTLDDYLLLKSNPFLQEVEITLTKEKGDKQVEYSLDELSFEELRKINVSGKKDMILFIHGWQPFKKDAFIAENGDPIGDWTKATGRLEGTWNTFTEYIDNNNLNDRYDTYAFLYDGVFKTPEEYAAELARQMKSNGLFDEYENIYIIAHSMGGIVSRFLMNENYLNDGKKIGEAITKLITVNTPHLGSPMGNLFDILEKAYLEDDIMFFDEPGNADKRWEDFKAYFKEVLIPFFMKKDIGKADLAFLEETPVYLLDQIPTFLPILTSDIYMAGFNGLTTPYPAYRSLRMTDTTYLNRLSEDLFDTKDANVFGISKDTAYLNNHESYSDKILPVNSYIGYQEFLDFTLTDWRIKEKIDVALRTFGGYELRISNFMILNQLLERGGKATESDGVVPLFSQIGEGLGFDVKTSMSYDNLGHNQILNDGKVVKDIFEYIEAINSGSEEPDQGDSGESSEAESEILEKMLEKKYDEVIAILDEMIRKNPNSYYYYSLRGLVYAEMEAHQKSLSDYRVALGINPESSDILNNIGTEYGYLGDDETALDYYTQALRIEESAIAYLNRAGVYNTLLKQGYTGVTYEKILSDYNRAIELDPGMAIAYNNRGTVYFDMGRYNDALADYSRAILENRNQFELYHHYLQTPESIKTIKADELNISVVVINELKKTGQALSDVLTEEVYVGLINNLIEEIKSLLYSNYFNRGNLYTVLDKFDMAEADYNLALEFVADDVNVQYSLGYIYLKKGNYKKAVEKFETCLSKGLKEYSTCMNLATAYSKLGYTSKALEAYEQAITLKPDGYDAYYNKIWILYEAGDFNAALKEINNIMNRFSAERELYSLRASCNYQLGDYQSSADDYLKVIEMKRQAGEEIAESLYSLASCYMYLEKENYALDALENAEREGVDGEKIFSTMANLYLKAGDDNKAREYLQKMIDVGQGTANTYYNLGYLHYKVEAYSESITALNHAIALNGKNGVAYYLRGVSYYKTGDKKQAIEDFKKGCELGDENSCKVLTQLGVK